MSKQRIQGLVNKHNLFPGSVLHNATAMVDNNTYRFKYQQSRGEPDQQGPFSIVRSSDAKEELLLAEYASSDETASVSSFSSEEDDIYENNQDKDRNNNSNRTGLEPATVTTSTATTASPSFSLLLPLSVLARLYRGIAADFCSSGLPWSGMECRSLRAGGSGVLFLLPLLTEFTTVGQLWWILQTILSVQADYFHIHHSSIWHGLDRIAAVITFVISAYRGCAGLDLTIGVPCVVAASFFYAMASRAKDRSDLAAWKWYHFGWHVVSSLIMAIGLHFVHARQGCQEF